LELTGRARNLERRKLSMRSPLNALRSNDLFERRWIVTRFWFLVNKKRASLPVCRF
jgi:hypothetical protein